MGRIEAVCISEAKGVQKHSVAQGRLQAEHGLVGDAHAGKWHRQVSLLAKEQIEAFKERGEAVIDDGAFGENLVVSGLDLARQPVGTRLSCGEAILEVTQIGKECHQGCQIRQVMGDCIMPREGIFTRVLRGGTVTAGDTIDILQA